MKRALVLIAVVLGLWSLPLAAGEFLMNDSGEMATALRVTFSEPVTVTGFGDMLMDVTPSGGLTEFTFSGGQVEAWGAHWLNWEPENVTLLNHEWLVEVPPSVLDETNFSSGAVIVIDGTQSFADSITFDPDLARYSPGDVVVWRLNLAELEGPFTITPELDNDQLREPTVVSESGIFSLEHKYDRAGVYVPYVDVADGNGVSRRIYSTTVISIFPDLEPRERIGLLVPTPKNPVGDFIKGIQVLCLDERRFLTAQGEEGLKQELAGWADAGMNLAMYNIPLFVDDISSNVTYPHYGDDAPVPFVATWDFDAIIKLTDWAHDLGIRVALRPFMMTLGDHTGGRRGDYRPSDINLYFHYHRQIKAALAELAELLGIELFSLDAENPVTTGSMEALQVLESVREVFSGIVTNSPSLDTGVLHSSPLTSHLDLLYIDHGPYIADLQDAPTSQLASSFYIQMTQEVLPILYRSEMPGIVETFVTRWPSGDYHLPGDPAFQAQAFDAFLSFFEKHNTLLMGVTFWETSLDHRRYKSQFEPFGQPAESVLTDYFGVRISSTRAYSFEPPFIPPEVALILDTFDSRALAGQYSLFEARGNAEIDSSRNEKREGSGALRAAFTPTEPDGYRHYMLISAFPEARDWSKYGSLNIWVKTDGTVGKIRLEVHDEDGDRFTALLDTPPAEWGWMLITVRLTDLYQPDWAQRGDGLLDLTRVTRWSFGQQCDEASRVMTTLLDLAFLGN